MPFAFDNLSRIGNDNIDLSQRNVQNLHSANYNLLNFFASDCTMAPHRFRHLSAQRVL